MTPPTDGTPRPADSAGVPWAGRDLHAHPFAGDDGSAAPALAAALAGWRAGPSVAGLRAVIAALGRARVFVPVVPVATSRGRDAATGLATDNASEMAVAFVAAPDGRRALPVFSAAGRVTAWNPRARPVPAESSRAALAAVQEGAELAVLDPGAEEPAVLVRRPALWALAQGRAWRPAWDDPEVAEAVRAEAQSAQDELGSALGPAVAAVACEPGPGVLGPGAEVRVVVALRPGLAEASVRALVGVLGRRLRADPTVAERIDSLEVRLTTADA